VDRRELADFLRAGRARLGPSDVGLPAGTRRRTPGLRREEVAQLAHISVDYYARLEQARGRRPSRRVLAAIEWALRLSPRERAHLFALAGEAPEPQAGPPREVRSGVLDLLTRLPDRAAIVVDAKFDVLAWNPLAAALLEDFAAVPPGERNLIRRHFLATDPRLRDYGVADAVGFARYSTGHLRAAAARYPDDPGIRGLVADLLAGSPAFVRLWASHDVVTVAHRAKLMHHPVVGDIALHCDVLAVPDRDQQVVLFTADPGSPSEQALRLLSVVGTDRIAVPG
jgi:transcriptional regulator with XRE-family HTH domain